VSAFQYTQIKLIFPIFKTSRLLRNSKKKSSSGHVEQPRKEKNVQRFIERDGVWLSFYPVLDKDVFDDDIISYYRIYVLNHTDDDLIFELSIYYGINKEIDLRNSIRALDEMYLFDLPFENLNDQPRMDFDFSLANMDKKKVGHL